jgi:hypothetical protein
VSQAPASPDVEQVEHTDHLELVTHWPSIISDKLTTSRNVKSPGGQLVFLPGYSGPEQVARLNQAYDISLEFWWRHLGTVLTKSSAACNIFQLRIWTVGLPGI